MRLLPAILIILPLVGCDEHISSGDKSRLSRQEVSILALSTECDLGAVQRNQPAIATFAIVNLSEGQARLQLGQPTCACTSVSISKPTLNYGEQCDLTMEINSRRKAGPVGAQVLAAAKGQSWASSFSVSAVILGSDFPSDLVKVPAGMLSQTINIFGEIYCVSPHPLLTTTLDDIDEKALETVTGTLGDLVTIGKPQLSVKRETKYYNQFAICIPLEPTNRAREIQIERRGILWVDIAVDGNHETKGVYVCLIPAR